MVRDFKRVEDDGYAALLYEVACLTGLLLLGMLLPVFQFLKTWRAEPPAPKQIQQKQYMELDAHCTVHCMHQAFEIDEKNQKPSRTNETANLTHEPPTRNLLLSAISRLMRQHEVPNLWRGLKLIRELFPLSSCSCAAESLRLAKARTAACKPVWRPAQSMPLFIPSATHTSPTIMPAPGAARHVALH